MLLQRRPGVHIRIITGDEEAAYDFIGATQSIVHADGILVDIGGGSTEIVSFAAHQMQSRWSLPLGSLAMRSGRVAGLLPTKSECSVIEDEVHRILDAVPAVRLLRARHMIGMGGILSSASRMHGLLYPSDAPRVLRAAHLPDMIRMFCGGAPLDEERTDILLRSATDRLHNIIPGMLITSVLAETFAAEDIAYSDSGVREGYIWKEIIGEAAADCLSVS